ncbi:MAG: hypothetical protein HYY06_00300 [Deltaproteobacteria bacterium]|nr:hypothetical protein [Deltaproteobacteria bacterium]
MGTETRKTAKIEMILDYKSVTTDPKVAGRFARRLVDEAARLVPEKEWTVEDVRDVLSFAASGDDAAVPVLDARQYRKRLREEVARAERYKQTFSTMIVGVDGTDGGDEVYSSVLDALIERLRKTDMVFLYKRHLAIIMPHTAAPVLSTLVGRIRALIAAVAATEVEQVLIDATSFPSRDFASGQAFLEWADGKLKD